MRLDAEDGLRWDHIDATDVAVTAHNGVVTLAGFVRSYSELLQIERDAKRVAGVIGVANDLQVRLPNLDERPDPEITRAGRCVRLNFNTSALVTNEQRRCVSKRQPQSLTLSRSWLGAHITCGVEV